MDGIKIHKDGEFKPVKISAEEEEGQAVRITKNEPIVKYDEDDTEMFNSIMKDKDVHEPAKSVSPLVQEDYAESEYVPDNDWKYEEQYKPDEKIYSLDMREIKMKKAHYLYKLNKLNKHGRYSTLMLDMDSELNTIENEYIRVERQIEIENGSDFVKQMFMAFSAGWELVLTKQTIMKLNVKNISYKFAMDCNEPKFEKMFTEIYDQYLSSMDRMDPLLSLAFAVIMMTVQFHYSSNPYSVNSNVFEEPDIEEESLHDNEEEPEEDDKPEETESVKKEEEPQKSSRRR